VVGASFRTRSGGPPEIEQVALGCRGERAVPAGPRFPAGYVLPTNQYEKARPAGPGFFESGFAFLVHRLDDQVSAAQQKDRHSNEQKNRHAALLGCSRRPVNA
jgi:hypothetical protein